MWPRRLAFSTRVGAVLLPKRAPRTLWYGLAAASISRRISGTKRLQPSTNFQFTSVHSRLHSIICSLPAATTLQMELPSAFRMIRVERGPSAALAANWELALPRRSLRAWNWSLIFIRVMALGVWGLLLEPMAESATSAQPARCHQQRRLHCR